MIMEPTPSERIQICIGEDKFSERPFVFCHDVEGLIEAVCLVRGKDWTQMENKVGFDDGKGKSLESFSWLT
jgi:hypothetical protein